MFKFNFLKMRKSSNSNIQTDKQVIDIPSRNSTSTLDVKINKNVILTKSRSMINNYNNLLIDIESNPQTDEIKNNLLMPDIIVKGVKSKSFKAYGGMNKNMITLDKLHVKNLFSIIDSRKYFRLAFLRVVWIPSANELPGNVCVSIMDLRAKPGKQIIDQKYSKSNDMFNYDYSQEIYIHKSELKLIAINIDLQGYEEKFNDNFVLGSFRIFWVIQNTNLPTKFLSKESIVNNTNLVEMPNILRLKDVNQLDRLETNQIGIQEIEINKKEVNKFEELNPEVSDEQAIDQKLKGKMEESLNNVSIDKERKFTLVIKPELNFNANTSKEIEDDFMTNIIENTCLDVLNNESTSKNGNPKIDPKDLIIDLNL